MKPVTDFVAQSRKAVIGLIVSTLVSLVAARGVDLPADVVAAVTGLLTAVSVWLIPNQEG